MINIEFGKEYKYKELCHQFGEYPERGSKLNTQLTRFRNNYDIEKTVSNKYLIKKKYSDIEIIENKNEKKLLLTKANLSKDGRYYHLDVSEENYHRSAIYIIYSDSTKEVYIGQTKDVLRRFNQHYGNYSNLFEKTSMLLHSDGKMKVLEYTNGLSKIAVNELEQYYINQYSNDMNFISINSQIKDIKTTNNYTTQILIDIKDLDSVVNLLQQANIEFQRM